MLCIGINHRVLALSTYMSECYCICKVLYTRVPTKFLEDHTFRRCLISRGRGKLERLC